MKTITYNEQTHRLVPVEPTTPLPDLPPYIARGNAGLYYYDTRQMHQYAMRYLDAVISAAPQPEPVEVEPVAWRAKVFQQNYCPNGWHWHFASHPSTYHDCYQEPLYTAPPSCDACKSNKQDYEAVKKQRDDMVQFAEEVRRSGDTRLASMAIAALASVKGEEA